MAKGLPPAFQFYASDWLGSTRIALMTLEQQGAYIRLLCHAWADDDCSLPGDDRLLANLSTLGQRWGRLKTEILACFDPHPERPERLINAKLYAVRQAQIEARESGSRGGQRSAEKRWGGKGQGKGTDKGDRKGQGKGGGKGLPEGSGQGFCNPPSPTPSPVTDFVSNLSGEVDDDESTTRAEKPVVVDGELAEAVEIAKATPYLRELLDPAQALYDIRRGYGTVPFLPTLIEAASSLSGPDGEAAIRKSKSNGRGNPYSWLRWFFQNERQRLTRIDAEVKAAGTSARKPGQQFAAGATDAAIDEVLARRAAKGNA
jgi:uncharacterized protein YdaU (DUF1376 family)